jgi:hypothetical protein
MAQQTIAAFLASLRREMRLGRVIPQTEHHLRREFSARMGSR